MKYLKIHLKKKKNQQYVILSKDCDESITHLEINQNRIIDEIENNNNNLQIKDIEYLQLNSYKKSLIRLLLIKIKMYRYFKLDVSKDIKF